MTYDGKDQILTVTVYDDLNRLTSIVYPDSSTEDFTYDAVGNLSGYTDIAGQAKSFACDDADRLITITYASDSSTISFTYDDMDNLLTQTERNDDLLTYTYDDLDRLTSVVRTAALGNTTPEWEFHYTYDELNQITENVVDDNSTITTWTYTHDDNGNMTSKSDGTDTYTYVWNEDNQLESVESNSSPVVDYLYDSGSRMLQRTESSTTTNFHWDGWDLVREEKDDGVDVEVTNYLVPHGEVHAFERDDEWFYLHGDGLSSTQLVTDESGAQVGRIVYGAWGETLSSNESVPGVLDVRFVGGLGVRNDSASGLIWMRHRWYDASLGRFISRDPIGLKGDTNLYRYGGNNSVTYTDHTGLQPGFEGDPIPNSPPLPTPVPTDPDILRLELMKYEFNIFLPDSYLHGRVKGLCRCPEDYVPISDSVEVRALNALESFVSEGPGGKAAPGVFPYKTKFKFGEKPIFPRTDFKFTCKCENACGDVIEVPLELSRESILQVKEGTVT
jgi:RHS repeat-associated protein